VRDNIDPFIKMGLNWSNDSMCEIKFSTRKWYL